MSAGFIFNWRQFEVAGTIRVTDDPQHMGDDATFRLSSCSASLRTFLQTHDTDSLSVTFDLLEDLNGLRARNVQSV
jgi:hypothetical protein